jgi:hypothetical protein
MSTKEQNTDNNWDKVVQKLSNQFADGERLDMESIMYLIGVQELGKGFQEFTKDDKINLMHIAICRVLSPFGYYQFESRDDEGWPHYTLLKEVPQMSATAQTELMQEAIVQYFMN